MLSHLFFFFFNDTATTEIYTRFYTLSLHDALPIWREAVLDVVVHLSGEITERCAVLRVFEARGEIGRAHV